MATYGLPSIPQATYNQFLSQSQAAQQANTPQPGVSADVSGGSIGGPDPLSLLSGSGLNVGGNNYGYVPLPNGGFGFEVKTGPQQGTIVPYTLQGGQYVPQDTGQTTQPWNTSSGNALANFETFGIPLAAAGGTVAAGVGALGAAGGAGSAAGGAAGAGTAAGAAGAGGAAAAAPSFIGAGSTAAAGAGAGVADASAGSSLLGGLGSLFGGGGTGGGGMWGSLIGGLLQAGGSLGAAAIQSNAAQAGSQAQIDLEREALNRSGALNAPFIQAGTGALGQLQNLLSGGAPSFDLSKMPGYQFQLGQGLGAIENSAAARGTQLSGNTLRDLQGYGQGLASTQFNNYLAQLSGLAQMGQASASGQAATGANLLNQAGLAANQGITGAGNAMGAGLVGATNAVSAPLNQYYNNQLQQQLLGQLFQNQANQNVTPTANIQPDAGLGVG